MNGAEPLLDVSGLRVRIGGAEAVSDVSFTVGPGEAVGVVGESGSGKTLVCRSILGVLPPGGSVTAGRIGFEGQDVTTLPERRWRRLRGHRIGAVFQDPASYLNPSIRVGRQVTEQIRLVRGGTRESARAAAAELLRAVGLRPETIMRRYPHELSGGMSQRLLIALAVAGEPQLLVADEPTTALDVAVQAEVLELLTDLRRRTGLALLLVSHDLAVVGEVCDRVVVLYAGQVVESGPTAEVLARPRHPYTRALLSVALPGDGGRRELEVIPGVPPAPGQAGSGCRFAPRCRYALEVCRTGAVPVTGGDRHSVRCARAGDLDPAVVAA
jgi:peptide/nickel transport system ATP-binding protein